MFCRLQRPNNCPNNGTRPENCKECRSNLYKEAGNTTYTKIRIDLTSLKVISKYTSCTPDYLKKPKRLLLNWCHGLIKANYVHSLFYFFILANSNFILLLKRAVIIKHTSHVSIKANYVHSFFPFMLANAKFILLLKRVVIIKHASLVSILANDSTFTTGSYGKTIPFATAGDCYSSQGNCPQVCYQFYPWQI